VGDEKLNNEWIEHLCYLIKFEYRNFGYSDKMYDLITEIAEYIVSERVLDDREFISLLKPSFPLE